MKDHKSINTFLKLVKAGLWGKEVRLDSNNDIDWQKIYQVAGEQGVLGLVVAALEVSDIKPPQMLLLQMIGAVQMTEQRNKAMNGFISELFEKMRKGDIFALLVKGQGVAQCYEKPEWRASGDIDLFFDEENYRKARELFIPLSSVKKNEERYSKHWGMNVGQWYLEIHGTLRTGLSSRVDKIVDEVQNRTFMESRTRTWNNGNTEVPLPCADDDVFYVFTHFIKHFYKEGISLRQLCDWCRLMWTCKDSLNHELLEERIRRAGLIGEWKAFAAIAVEYLGMPVEAMSLYDADEKWKRKAAQITEFILKGGEWKKCRDTYAVAKIFPKSVMKFASGILLKVNWMKVKERVWM